MMMGFFCASAATSCCDFTPSSVIGVTTPILRSIWVIPSSRRLSSTVRSVTTITLSKTLHSASSLPAVPYASA